MTKTVTSIVRSANPYVPSVDAPLFDTIADTPVPVAALIDLLSYRRADGSPGEALCIERYLAPLAPREDVFGNFYVVIGKNPEVMFTAHTDTVHHGHKKDGPISQQLETHFDNRVVGVKREKGNGNCLGADDGTGWWLLLNLIAAEVPGLYVFFRAEESGRQGSEYLASNHGTILPQMGVAELPKACISFDRASTSSIISHQMGQRCCSQAFIDSLNGVLETDEHGFIADDTGSFTDSYSFVDLISECTNVSVGYNDQHSAYETQDLTFAAWLANRLIAADWSALTFEREPGTDIEELDESILALVKHYPEAVTLLLQDEGFSARSLEFLLGDYVQNAYAFEDILTERYAPDDFPIDFDEDDTL